MLIFSESIETNSTELVVVDTLNERLRPVDASYRALSRPSDVAAVLPH